MTDPAAVPQVHGRLLPTSVVEQVRALARDAHETDGIEALGEQTLLNLADPAAAVVHLTILDDTGLRAYAQLDLTTAASGSASAELVVAPPARRRGLGSALLAAVRTQAREAGVERPAIWAHGNLPGARALAEAAGLQVVRELWQMGLDLEGHRRRRTEGAEHPEGPAQHRPADLVVRPFEVGRDEDAWLRVNARAFADHPEQGRMTRSDLEAREREPWFAAEDLLLAERDGRLLASAWMKVEPGSDEGELYALGVDPDAQGSGLGRLLTARVLDHLADAGLRRAVLYTEADNAGAVRTYTSAGFVTARADVQYA